MRRLSRLAALTIGAVVAGAPSTRAASPDVAPPATFRAVIAPLLQTRCVRCHGPEEASGDLRLDSYEAILRGGERGPVIVRFDPEASLLIAKVQRRDRPPMPPRKPIAASEVRLLKNWIAAGAPR